MQWFQYVLDLIDSVGKSMPLYIDSLKDIFLGTLNSGFENSGAKSFFEQIPFLGDIINIIIEYIIGPIGNVTFIDFILGSGIGAIIFVSLVKWIKGLV